MPVLRYYDEEGKPRNKEFGHALLIGKDPSRQRFSIQYDTLAMPWIANIEREHAIIMRSQESLARFIVDLAGHDVFVQGQRIQGLHMLNHNDELIIGDDLKNCNPRFWEIYITTIGPDKLRSLARCPVDERDFELGQDIIVCPGFPILMHRECFFSVRSCPRMACNYPIMKAVMNSLVQEGIRFAENSTINSPMLSEYCSARNRQDKFPFRPDDLIVYCRYCQKPYHLQCWLKLDACLECDEKIQEFLDKVFKLQLI